jgi:hypothetical protein
MMLKKPVTPLTSYSTPAILAIRLVEFIPALLLLMTLAGETALRCNLLTMSRPGGDTASAIMLSISIFRRFQLSLLLPVRANLKQSQGKRLPTTRELIVFELHFEVET